MHVSYPDVDAKINGVSKFQQLFESGVEVRIATLMECAKLMIIPMCCR